MTVRWCWRKALGLKSLAVTSPNEMFPGVPRPSHVLAGMVAAKILANPLLLKRKNDYGPENRTAHTKYTDYYTETAYTWESGPVYVQLVHKVWSHSSCFTKKWKVSFRGREYGFGEDIEVIEEALFKAKEQAVEMRRNQQESERQQQACDLIETLFTTPPQQEQGT